MIKLTEQEQIQKHFDACMDSVNLLQAGKPEEMTEADWLDTVARNREHLSIMLAKNIFDGFDIIQIKEAAQ